MARNNIFAEYLFALTDYVDGLLRSGSATTAGGVATSQANKMFDTAPAGKEKAEQDTAKGITEQWGDELFGHAVDMMMDPKYRKANEERDRDDLKQMRLIDGKRKQKEEVDNMVSLLENEIESISYRNLQSVKTVAKLNTVWEEMKKAKVSRTRLYEWVKNQIKVYTLGYGMKDYYIPWSVGGVYRSIDELKSQLTRILEIVHVRPELLISRPALPTVSDLSVFGESTKEVVDIHAQLVSTARDSMKDLANEYGIHLSIPWQHVQPVTFPKAFTALQQKFKRGVKFSDDGVEYVCLGLEYSEDMQDYAMYYFCGEDVPTSYSDAEHSYFEDIVTRKTHTLGINNWENLQIEGDEQQQPEREAQEQEEGQN